MGGDSYAPHLTLEYDTTMPVVGCAWRFHVCILAHVKIKPEKRSK